MTKSLSFSLEKNKIYKESEKCYLQFNLPICTFHISHLKIKKKKQNKKLLSHV